MSDASNWDVILSKREEIIWREIVGETILVPIRGKRRKAPSSVVEIACPEFIQGKIGERGGGTGRLVCWRFFEVVIVSPSLPCQAANGPRRIAAP